MSDTETPIHLVVGMVLDGVADADERQRVREYIKQLEAAARERDRFERILTNADKQLLYQQEYLANITSDRDKWKDRAYEAEAKVDGLTMRAECAEHAAGFADTYARYYHEHELARAAGRESQHPYTFDVWYILSDDVGRRTRALMHEGELVVSDFEGGFGPDEISIADSNMSELIARWMGLQLNGRGSLVPIKEGQIKLGLVRLILERL